MGDARSYLVPPTDYIPSGVDTRAQSMVTKSSYFFQGTWWRAQGYPVNSSGIPSGIPDIIPDEQHIREAANAAITLAVCADWGGYSSSAAGGLVLDLEKARLIAARLVVGIYRAHRNYDRTGWGYSWQSAFWAYGMGLAAWLLWESRLNNESDREWVCDIIEAEADFQLFNHRPEVWKNAAGVEQAIGAKVGGAYYTGGGQGTRNGDSAVEEDYWSAALCDLASVMMPTHPRALMWARRAAQYTMTGSAALVDWNNTTTVVNGYTPRQWITGSAVSGMGYFHNLGADGGYNLDSQYLVTNHGRINPDYMQAAVVPLQCGIMHGLAGVAIPEWTRYNQERIYGAMRTVLFSGKAMYQSTSTPTLYFPVSADWGIARHTGYWLWDTLAETMILGAPNATSALVPVSPTTWANVHGNAAKAMQDRGSKPYGQVVANDTEDKYSGREGWHASSAAYIVLNQGLKGANRLSWTNAAI